MGQRSKMYREIIEIPDALRRLIGAADDMINPVADDLRRLDPPLIATVARGSSDHAASYLKYAIELTAGVPVASLGPSIASIYGRALKMEKSVGISISQSGKSPDILKMTEMIASGGATTISLTNDMSSPLAGACHHSINIMAGNEQSVAATKTFVTSVVAGLLLLAKWQQEDALLKVIGKLPDYAAYAIDCDWSALADHLQGRDALYVLGRGPGLAIAREAALKFKEVCQIQAAAYSSAEVMHGPKSIVDDDFTLLSFVARDASQTSMIKVNESLTAQGAQVFATSHKITNGVSLPFVSTGHPLTDPLMLIISYYVFIEKLARIRGQNPDHPPHLKKVTETV